MQQNELFELLEEKYLQFNNASFIEADPICIPHGFSKKQDIEISAFFAATFAWGQRKTIINKTRELITYMDHAPHDFVLNYNNYDLKKLRHFKHRTFQFVDLVYFLERLKKHYQAFNSLEEMFCQGHDTKEKLINFERNFSSLPSFTPRTGKHLATPARNSTCKRLNMYLRWMVRKDNIGVDFGIWNKIKTAELHCPFDVHVERIARLLGLIERKQRDWQTVEELSVSLRKFDKNDPAKYDFALFGLGILEKI